MSGTQDVVIAGGVESMSQVPIGANIIDGYKADHGLPYGARIGERYPGIQFSQFAGAEKMIEKYELSKEELEDFALASHMKAKRAVEEGRFDGEIVAIEVELEDGSREMHVQDEGIRMEATLVQEGDAIGDLVGRVHVVSDDDLSHSELLFQRVHVTIDEARGDGIEAGCGLVVQQDFRFRDESPGEATAFAHAAGNL